MKHFSLKDMKAEAFNRPFPSQNRATAIREISTQIESDEKLSSYASDFALYEVGDFDENNGRWTIPADPIHILDCIEMKEADDQTQPSPG